MHSFEKVEVTVSLYSAYSVCNSNTYKIVDCFMSFSGEMSHISNRTTGGCEGDATVDTPLGAYTAQLKHGTVKVYRAAHVAGLFRASERLQPD